MKERSKIVDEPTNHPSSARAFESHRYHGNLRASYEPTNQEAAWRLEQTVFERFGGKPAAKSGEKKSAITEA